MTHKSLYTSPIFNVDLITPKDFTEAMSASSSLLHGIINERNVHIALPYHDDFIIASRSEVLTIWGEPDAKNNT